MSRWSDGKRFVPAAWRDVDSESPKFGVVVWAGRFTGGELRFGRRLYRLRLTVPR